MPSINFEKNYNNKLHCVCFTSLRLHNDYNYSVGLNYTIMLKRKNFGVAKLIEKRVLRLDQLNEFIAHIDAGVPLKELISMIKSFYTKKSIDWNTQQLDLLLFEKIKDKAQQRHLFNS